MWKKRKEIMQLLKQLPKSEIKRFLIAYWGVPIASLLAFIVAEIVIAFAYGETYLILLPLIVHGLVVLLTLLLSEKWILHRHRLLFGDADSEKPENRGPKIGQDRNRK